jgi:cysteine synthase
MVVAVAREEGMLISPSAGASLAAARSIAEELEYGTVVTTLADDASKYSEVLDQLF